MENFLNSVSTKCHSEWYLVYTEDTVTKMNDGDLTDTQQEYKVVWIYPSSQFS